ncbi:cyclic lactone autoinducer peptide [Orenia metallireducens]|nr:cyclic lactone autoinducer peptide [Orenia metallireducens]
MKVKEIVAKLLKRSAEQNVAAACTMGSYQPELPEALKEDK